LHTCREGGQRGLRLRARLPALRTARANYLLDQQRFPATDFGDLYHQRWRIEEAFKRLEHRLNLEHVSGLSQLAAMQDFAAKIVCDNLQALTTAAASDQFPILPTRRVNRGYAHTVLTPLLPSLLLRFATAVDLLCQAMALIASQTFFNKPGLSKPRKKAQCRFERKLTSATMSATAVNT
jgi:hypothetical protein